LEKLFEQYILRFPFWGDFYPSKVGTLPPFNDRSLYLDLRKWYGDPANKATIDNLIEMHSEQMKALKKTDQEKFEAQKKELQFKVPSVDSLSTYIGMFDEE